MLDENFHSSSSHGTTHGPQNSRLSTVHGNEQADAWVSGQNSVGQWIEVDFSEQKTIEAIELRTRVAAGQWVSSYRLAFSNDGVDYSFVKIPNGDDRIFTGPSAYGEIVTSSFETRQARYIRLYPITYTQHMAVKWEVYGCNQGKLFLLTAKQNALTN